MRKLVLFLLLFPVGVLAKEEATAPGASASTPVVEAIIPPTPNPQRIFIRKLSTREDGLAEYMLVASSSKELGKLSVVLSYPAEAEIKDIVTDPANKCTVTNKSDKGSLTANMTCEPPLTGSVRVLIWAMTPSVEPGDFKATSCTVTGTTDVCLLLK